MDLSMMQTEHVGWACRNFGPITTTTQFMGMAEELGELAHALLKHEQGIRGVDETELLKKVIDAHCDLIIFSLGLASVLEYDLWEELEATWTEVSKRDWVLDPLKGKP